MQCITSAEFSFGKFYERGHTSEKNWNINAKCICFVYLSVGSSFAFVQLTYCISKTRVAQNKRLDVWLAVNNIFHRWLPIESRSPVTCWKNPDVEIMIGRKNRQAISIRFVVRKKLWILNKQQLRMFLVTKLISTDKLFYECEFVCIIFSLFIWPIALLFTIF